MGLLYNGPTSFQLPQTREVKIRNLDDPWWILFYGDIHKWALLHADKAWEEWLAGAKETPNALYIGMGDVQDDYRATERRILDEMGFDTGPRMDVNDMQILRAEKTAAEMKFMAKYTLAEIEGNHWGIVTLPEPDNRRMTTTQYRCELNGVPYGGAMALIEVRFKWRKQVFPYTLLVHHGRSGGGVTAGLGITQVSRLVPSAIADVYAMGHSHETAAKRLPRTRRVERNGKPHIVVDEILLVRTGNMMKGWEPGIPSYIARMGRTPLPLALAAIRLDPMSGTDYKPYFHMKARALV